MKKLYQNNKVFLRIYISLIILISFLEIIHFHKITFFLLSVTLNVLLINILVITKKTLKIKFSKIDYGIILGAILIVYLFYSISLMTRNFIYYWDYACYYKIQIDTIDAFQSGIFHGLKSFLSSTFSGEYGSFLCFIPQVFFGITNKTPDSYVSSCTTIFTPYIIYSLALLLKTGMNILKSKKQELVLGTSLFIFILMPIYHATALLGQPDFFGLFFIFLIIALTINYNFEKLELERLIVLFLVNYFLLISRRWYVYFMISYYLCYGISVIISNWKDKKKLKSILKNAGVFIGISFLIYGITLFPLIKNILVNDFKNHYGFYLNGGFEGELASQIKHLGFITLILIGIGLLIGLINKDYRKYTIISFLQIFIMVFLFTRIQNMGTHHSLVLLPSYYYLILVIILFFEKSNRSIFINTLIILILGINFFNGVVGTKNLLFTDILLKAPYQEDYKEMKKVADWLQDNLNEENTAYMITHNNMYNPDKFRMFYMPDKTIEKYLPYGSAVVGVHKFPIELFTSKYIITTTPFENISIENKYEEVFEELVNENKFSFVKNFDMNNGYQILIYERVKDVDEEEINKYKIILEEESKKYPKLYQKVMEDYLK
ncbi:MAG: hypothetical protein IJG68_00700 [Bacilli bacterium]|nr:hypothetical protein [Bacilli bacterium]